MSDETAKAIAADAAEEIREAIGRCRSPYDVHRIDFHGLIHGAIVRHTSPTPAPSPERTEP